MYVCMYVHDVCMYVYMYVCVYVCMYVCIVGPTGTGKTGN